MNINKKVPGTLDEGGGGSNPLRSLIRCLFNQRKPERRKRGSESFCVKNKGKHDSRRDHNQT